MAKRKKPDAPVPFTPALDYEPGAKLRLSLNGEIEVLRGIIDRARCALEEGRRGDALKELRQAYPNKPHAGPVLGGGSAA